VCLLRSVKSNMHKVMRKDPLTNELSGSIGIALHDMDDRIDNFVRQLDIDTATWALTVYEKELGIAPDPLKPLEQRRSLIKSKIRGSGAVGAAQIKLVADSYTNGDVEVSLNHGIVIEFKSIFGIPTNIEDLKSVLRQIAPAHLNIKYVFRYTVYNDIKSKRYDQISIKTYHDILNGGV